tara:strand:+ start:514 stop:1212 length:699 start_codon:yes stop_codon:yes gene_type:complete
MNWHYALNGQQLGPISEGELSQLYTAGTVRNDTLVWREGLPDWQPLSIALPQLTAASGGLPMANPGMAVQQMREGVTATTASGVEYAGFWIRFGAWMIDYVILTVISFILMAIAGVSAGLAGTFENLEQNKEPDPMVIVGILLFYGVMFAIVFGYKIVMVGKYGATVGKMAVGIKVVTADGGKVGYMRATGRAFAEILSGLIIYIGYIIAAFDDEKRSLHDHICSTRVVMKR